MIGVILRPVEPIHLDRQHAGWFGSWNRSNLLARQAYDRNPNSTHNQPASPVVLDRQHIRLLGEWTNRNILARDAYDQHPDSTNHQKPDPIRRPV